MKKASETQLRNFVAGLITEYDFSCYEEPVSAEPR